MIDYVVSVKHKGGGERGVLLIGAEDKEGAEKLLYAQRFLYEPLGKLKKRAWKESEYHDSTNCGTEGLKGEVRFCSWAGRDQEGWPGMEVE